MLVMRCIQGCILFWLITLLGVDGGGYWDFCFTDYIYLYIILDQVKRAQTSLRLHD